jgi:hypothetical protein
MGLMFVWWFCIRSGHLYTAPSLLCLFAAYACTQYITAQPRWVQKEKKTLTRMVLHA